MTKQGIDAVPVFLPPYTEDSLGEGFTLLQPESGFRFSSDAVMLSLFPVLRGDESVLDLGCGSGVIPLLLLQRESGLRISGLELMRIPFEFACENMKRNNAAVRIVSGDAMKADRYFCGECFDLIVSNPPYYPSGSGRLPVLEDVAAAKTERYWNQKTMFFQVSRLLAEEGRFCLVFDASRREELDLFAASAGLFPRRRRLIYGRRGSPSPRRVLLEYSRVCGKCTEESPLFLDETEIPFRD